MSPLSSLEHADHSNEENCSLLLKENRTHIHPLMPTDQYLCPIDARKVDYNLFNMGRAPSIPDLDASLVFKSRSVWRYVVVVSDICTSIIRQSPWSEQGHAPTMAGDNVGPETFAMKILTRPSDGERERQFRNEMRAVRSLTHNRHIVNLCTYVGQFGQYTPLCDFDKRESGGDKRLLNETLSEIGARKHKRWHGLTNAALTLGQILFATPIAFYKAERHVDDRRLLFDISSIQMNDSTYNQIWEWILALLPPTISKPTPSLLVLASLGLGVLITLQYHHNETNTLQGPYLVVGFVSGILLTAIAYPTHGLQINTILPVAMIMAMIMSQAMNAVRKYTTGCKRGLDRVEVLAITRHRSWEWLK